MLSARRSIVTTSSIEGNELKSSDLLTNNTVIKMITENDIEMLNNKSTSQGGIGKTSTAMMPKIPLAKKISKWRFEFLSCFKNDSLSIGSDKLPILIII
jgi:hypothetical protein